MILTPIRHNIMTTCLMLCWSPFCCQNCPDPSKHGLRLAPEGVLWYLAPRRHQQILLSLVRCEVGAPWIRTPGSSSYRCSAGLRYGEFGGQVNTSNSLLCSSNHSWTVFRFVARRIILLKEATASQRVLFPWKGVPGQQQCSGRWYVGK